MQPELTPVDLIAAVGAAQGIFLALLLAVRKDNALSNRLLAGFVAVFALLTIGDIVYYSRLLLLWPHWWLLLDPLIFLLAPLCYLYALSLIQPDFALRARYLLHALPALTIYILLTAVYILPAEEKLAQLGYEYTHPPHGIDPLLLLAALQMLLYLAVTLLLLYRHRSTIRTYYSFGERVELRWLRVMVSVVAVLWVVFVIASLLNLPTFRVIDRVLFPVAVYAMGYMGIRQPAVFSRRTPEVQQESFTLHEPAETSPPEEQERKKYEHSTLTQEAAAVYAERLKELMVQQHPYLQADLRLQDIATQLDIRVHHLSQVLNEHLGQSFFDMVNSYRVDEVKKKLQDPAFRAYTLLAIALESGFNSKAAFNAAFKKHAGMTPSRYRTLHSAGQSDVDIARSGDHND